MLPHTTPHSAALHAGYTFSARRDDVELHDARPPLRLAAGVDVEPAREFQPPVPLDPEHRESGAEHFHFVAVAYRHRREARRDQQLAAAIKPEGARVPAARVGCFE